MISRQGTVGIRKPPGREGYGRKPMRRVIATALFMLGLAATACTPAQLATVSSLTGTAFTPTDSATLEALPDVPVRVGDQLVHPDGVTTPVPEEALSPRERLDLAISRTEWATRSDLHRKLRCIVNRETGGTLDPRAFNPRGRDRSYGYTQINMKAHSLDRFGLTHEEQLFDPETNLRAAWILFQAAGWSPWAATRNGC